MAKIYRTTLSEIKKLIKEQRENRWDVTIERTGGNPIMGEAKYIASITNKYFTKSSGEKRSAADALRELANLMDNAGFLE
ncbi:MAG: hypothetical protein WC460_06820 [Patescibacteria group bacterium]